MGKIVKERKLFVSKKPLYRQIAQARKQQWAHKYNLQHEEQYKFHFYTPQDHQQLALPKPDSKHEQKIKNRVAAQESREKRKNCFEEMQKKIQMYQELLETQTCRLCQSSLREKSESDLGMSEERGSTNEQAKQRYFQEGLIRIDNEGASTPFAIFFFICFLLLLSIFTYGGQNTEQRILSHDEPIAYSGAIASLNKEGEEYMKQPTNYLDMTLKALAENVLVPKHLRESLLSTGTDWNKYRDLLCTKSELGGQMVVEEDRKPFLALRQKSHLRTEQSQEVQKGSDTGQTLWDKDLLTCIVYKPIPV